MNISTAPSIRETAIHFNKVQGCETKKKKKKKKLSLESQLLNEKYLGEPIFDCNNLQF